jgi:hypothetical protein
VRPARPARQERRRKKKEELESHNKIQRTGKHWNLQIIGKEQESSTATSDRKSFLYSHPGDFSFAIFFTQASSALSTFTRKLTFISHSIDELPTFALVGLCLRDGRHDKRVHAALGVVHLAGGKTWTTMTKEINLQGQESGTRPSLNH